MDETNDREPDRLNRRTFLQRGASGALLGLGLLRQGNDEQQVKRRFVLRRVERFETRNPGDDYVGRGLLVTTKANVSGQPQGATNCAFSDWNPRRFVKYQALLFDPNRRIITESRAYIDAASDPIPTGTPYIIDAEVECSGQYVGVEGEQIPARLVE